MNITSIKVVDGSVTVKWTQEAANGNAAAWACRDAVRPPDALADAMQAIVPHVKAVLAIDTSAECAFSGATFKDDKKHQGNMFVQLALLLPSPNTERPATARTDKLATDGMDDELALCVEKLIHACEEYVVAARNAAVA